MIKKTVSIIGFVMLTFCFGLGIAGFIATDANAGDGGPIPSCDLGICFEYDATGCLPGEYRETRFDRRRGFGDCCGNIVYESGCNPPM